MSVMRCHYVISHSTPEVEQYIITKNQDNACSVIILVYFVVELLTNFINKLNKIYTLCKAPTRTPLGQCIAIRDIRH